ncbi:g8058 [Coccomyxa elongata]
MPFREVIAETHTPLTPSDFQAIDVVILGGTLGIFLAATLAKRGLKVACIERGKLLGRDQEWNISREDMKVFVEMGLLSEEELEEVLVSEFNPVRIGFEGISEITTTDVLNCGVSPKLLLNIVKESFLAAGGTLLEGAAFQSAKVHSDGVQVQLSVQGEEAKNNLAAGAGGEGARLEVALGEDSKESDVAIQAKVLVDAMGSFSPIAAQARKGQKPDSVVLMVGSCAVGLPPTSSADLLWSFTPINRERRLQYFWEVFPAQDGITTYMFAYTDPAPGSPSLKEVYADYLTYLPRYRDIPDLSGVSCIRPFFGFVPNWHDTPLKPITSRLLHIGDSAGNRSALSFAGFGSMARHLPRLTEGLAFALESNQTSRGALELLQPKSPAISMTAAMQFSMGTRSNQVFDGDNFDPNIIQNYLGSSFYHMAKYGEKVYRPFMQDYLQWSCLSKVVGGQITNEPGQLVRMTLFMRSPKAGQMFAANFLGILFYDLLFSLASFVSPAHESLLKPFPALLFRWRCLVDAFKYGSARDYRGMEGS